MRTATLKSDGTIVTYPKYIMPATVKRTEAKKK